ncbi:uncharacterized protein EKO05_0010546 [Ascochyta rabiei]|uniref:Uncharacterized protein n=1 Tax=Didymella rabiei TaxID=5454 RepID=A0A163KCS8_DIDRA|nr:uncharacterized protein EKO05_0010546 [Ascochyta rabiei]KZM26918.1 hypothetical protein ST47_g1934 [Ascochyta rabiei]UPX20310.1 hypothetical protein EKO05_0010546 [Ascochyta rabiei]
MLDENLPTFFLKATDKASKHQESFLFTQNGSEPDAQYALNHVDPASHAAKNTYAVALFDSHNPEILYGEVLARPGWSHPTLSQEEMRKNGGVPPPPQPLFPDQFAIQLYNPDTQILVREQKTKWSGTQSWEFSIPQVTFRTPSASTLDRSQNDPGADATTPRVNFVWRKEGRYAKDMTCYLTGKSTDLVGKKAKKSREPDIVVALFTMLKEMTIMEPNLYRIEIEDYKGLEVVLLLSAAVIRDMFINSQREAFHIVDPAVRKNSGGILTRKASSPLVGPGVTPPVMTPQPPPPPPYAGPSQRPAEKAAQASAQTARPVAAPVAVAAPTAAPVANFANRAAQRSSLPPLQTHNQQTPPQQAQHPYPQRPQQPGGSQRPQQNSTHPLRSQQRTAQRPQHPTQAPPQQPPRLDPRAQWEIDAETARLKTAVEAEAREQRKQEEAARKARRRAEAEEERKTLQFLENERKTKEKEEKERQRRQAEVDKETERLRKQFGDQSNILGSQQQARPQPQSQRHSTPHIQFQTQRPGPSRPQQRPAPVPAQPVFSAGPYLQPGTHRPTASASSFFSNGLPKPQTGQAPMKAKKSFWGLRSNSETNAEKLKKKKSSMF